MEPFRSSMLHSFFDHARSELGKKDICFFEANPLSQSPHYIKAYAESIRHSVLELQPQPQRYAILLLVSRDARNWSSIEEELLSDLREFKEKLSQVLHSSIPILIALNNERIAKELSSLDPNTTIFYGYPRRVCSSFEKLPTALDGTPFDFHPIQDLEQQPSFIRALAEIIWIESNNHPSENRS